MTSNTNINQILINFLPKELCGIVNIYHNEEDENKGEKCLYCDEEYPQNGCDFGCDKYFCDDCYNNKTLLLQLVGSNNCNVCIECSIPYIERIKKEMTVIKANTRKFYKTFCFPCNKWVKTNYFNTHNKKVHKKGAKKKKVKKIK